LKGLPVTSANLERARNEIVNVIVEQSPKMIERVMRTGDVEELKFLWQIAGLFPQPSGGARSSASPFGQYLDDPEG